MDLRTSKFSLVGGVALVTGATGFLGREHCDALAEIGAKVVVIDLDSEECDALAAQLSERWSVDACGVGADITRHESVRTLVSEIWRRFGRIDVLVNNAQLKLPSVHVPFEDLSLDDWNRVMAANVTGTFLCCQAVGPYMLRQRAGSIINFGSIYGMLGPDQRIYEGTPFLTPAVYSTSKSAIYGLTRYLATYWGADNIRVNAISPGGVFNAHEDPFLSAYSRRVPMGRMAERTELRGVVQFLASSASSYVTGQNIPVDGGLTAW